MISDQCKDLVRKMMIPRPAKRFSCSQCLEHDWFSVLGDARIQKSQVQLACNNIIRFSQMGKWKRAVMFVIARQMDIEKLKISTDIFFAFDTDGGGTLSYQNVKEGLKGYGVQPPEHLEESMAMIDADGSGIIDYTEFLAATMPKEWYQDHETLKNAFAVFDWGGEGMISMAELKKIFAEDDSLHIEKSEIDKLIKAIDKNRDGEIDVDEFIEMMMDNDGELSDADEIE